MFGGALSFKNNVNPASGSQYEMLAYFSALLRNSNLHLIYWLIVDSTHAFRHYPRIRRPKIIIFSNFDLNISFIVQHTQKFAKLEYFEKNRAAKLSFSFSKKSKIQVTETDTL